MTEHIARVISLYGTPDSPIILYNVCVPCQSRGRRQRSNISDRVHELTLEQKLYVVQREVTETQQDREKLKQKYQRIQDNYKVTTHPSTETKSDKQKKIKQTKTDSYSTFSLSRPPSKRLNCVLQKSGKLRVCLKAEC